VFARIPEESVAALAAHLREHQILVLPGARMRLVTHLDVDAAGIERALGAFRAFFTPSRVAPRPSAAGRR
jgi:threonine aldolase